MAEPSHSSQKGTPGSRRVHVLLIILAGLLVYSNTFRVPFVLDDIPNIVENQKIRSVSNIPAMFAVIEGPLAHRPLTLATFALNYAIGGVDTITYHIVNLFLHLINGILLYMLVITTAGFMGQKGEHAGLVALLSSILFVVHPVQTESVTYVVSRSMLLMTLFYFLGMLLFAKSVVGKVRQADQPGRGAHAGNKNGALYYVLALFVVSIMGMASREDFATFPVMLLLYDYFFVSDNGIRGVVDNWRVHLSVVLLFLYLVFLVASFDYKGAGFEGTGVSPMEYVLTQFNVHWTYLRLLVFPMGQNLDYDYPVAKGLIELPTLISSIGYLGLWGLVLYCIRRTPVVAFLMMWFLVAITPSSSLVPLADMIFEHRLYLPSAGFFTLAAVLIVFLFVSRQAVKVFILIPVVAVLVLGGAAYARNNVWTDGISLWGDVVRKSSNKARGYNNLGLRYSEREMPERAKEQFKKAISLYPEFSLAHNNIARIYIAEGDVETGLEHLQAAVRINPDYYKAHYNLGNLYMDMGRYKKAIGHLEAAVRLNPDYAEAYNNLGFALMGSGRPEAAIGQFRNALEVDRGFIEARINLGNAYMGANRFDKAIEQFDSILKLDPGFADAYYNLGVAYLNMGRYGAAEKHFRSSLRLNPGDAEAWHHLGRVSSALGRDEKAVEYYRIAERLDHDYERAYPESGNDHKPSGDAGEPNRHPGAASPMAE
jgi:tetratricopeptide (TPR) repeat protein